MKHKHADLIHAWADGAEIQLKDEKGCWVEAKPGWDVTIEYRIKPEPKPDVVRYVGCNCFGVRSDQIFDTYHVIDHWENQIKLTFDGETGKLKSAEVLK